MPIEAFAYPTTVSEAVHLLASAEKPAIPIGGGTAITAGGRHRAAVLVDITRCGLDRLETSGETIHIGATARVADIADAELPGAAGRLLSRCAQGVASQPLRNAITLGGNIMHLAAWSDLPVALLALNATVHVSHQERGAFDLSMAELVATHPQRVLPSGALLVGVTVPVLAGTCGATYRRFRTTVTDYSLVTVAAVVALEQERCVHAAIAVGAVGPRPSRAAQAEQILVGTKPNRRTIARAAASAVQEVRVAPNYRMAPEVRQRILEVEVRRAIEEAAREAHDTAID